MTTPFGGSIPDHIARTRAATVVLFAVVVAAEHATDDWLRSRLGAAARSIVGNLLPDLPDL